MFWSKKGTGLNANLFIWHIVFPPLQGRPFFAVASASSLSLQTAQQYLASKSSISSSIGTALRENSFPHFPNFSKCGKEISRKAVPIHWEEEMLHWDGGGAKSALQPFDSDYEVELGCGPLDWTLLLLFRTRLTEGPLPHFLHCYSKPQFCFQSRKVTSRKTEYSASPLPVLLAVFLFFPH